MPVSVAVVEEAAAVSVPEAAAEVAEASVDEEGEAVAVATWLAGMVDTP